MGRIRWQKIDLSLTITEHPEAQPSGSLVVLDRNMTTGRAIYTYHRERSAAAVRAAQQLMRDPEFGHLIRHKEGEHEQMVTISKTPEAMRAYLDGAPDGRDYEALAQRIRPAMQSGAMI
jgi:hypothetical protein